MWPMVNSPKGESNLFDVVCAAAQSERWRLGFLCERVMVREENLFGYRMNKFLFGHHQFMLV